MDTLGSASDREALLRQRIMELSRRFLQRAADDRQEMEAALLREDFGEVAALAHRLAGTSGSFGFENISSQAMRVEQAISAGAGSENINRACGELFSLIEDASAAKS